MDHSAARSQHAYEFNRAAQLALCSSAHYSGAQSWRASHGEGHRRMPVRERVRYGATVRDGGRRISAVAGSCQRAPPAEISMRSGRLKKADAGRSGRVATSSPIMSHRFCSACGTCWHRFDGNVDLTSGQLSAHRFRLIHVSRRGRAADGGSTTTIPRPGPTMQLVGAGWTPVAPTSRLRRTASELRRHRLAWILLGQGRDAMLIRSYASTAKWLDQIWPCGKLAENFQVIMPDARSGQAACRCDSYPRDDARHSRWSPHLGLVDMMQAAIRPRRAPGG